MRRVLGVFAPAFSGAVVAGASAQPLVSEFAASSEGWSVQTRRSPASGLALFAPYLVD
ncbi:MAG: hypothetical protein AAFR38_01905 [Planctomycetota bacterium]